MEEEHKPSREKYWSELDADGKIERMRQEVRRAQNQLVEAQENIRQLLQHSHSGSDIVIPLKRPSEDYYRFHSSSEPNEEYF